MAKSKKISIAEEQNDDTHSIDPSIEQKVDEMMRSEPSKEKKVTVVHHEDVAEEEAASAPVVVPKERKILIAHHDDEELPTAPTVKGKAVPKEPVKIAVALHEEAPVVTPPASQEEPKPVAISVVAAEEEALPQQDELQEAIESANEDLKQKTAAVVQEKAEPAVTQPTVEQVESSDTAPLPESYNDLETEKVINAIIAEDSDKLLSVEDGIKEAEAEVAKPKREGSLIGAFFKGWWRRKLARYGTLLFMLLILGGAFGYPTSRYMALNALGVRVSASVRVTDQSSLQPLKNAKVHIAGVPAETDENGVARVTNIRLGQTQLVVEKYAYAPIHEEIVLGWGSNPLGDRAVNPVGTQYTFVVTDYLSGKPVAGASATSGQADAKANDKGEVKIAFEHSEEATREVSVGANGYRTEKVTIDLNSKQQISLSLVVGRKEVFVSKQSGIFDVMKMDIDGKNKEKLLAGTGAERDDMVLAPHPTDEVVALVSTREGKRNADGYLLSSLSLINTTDNSVKNVSQSEQIHIVNWSGSRLVYVQVASGASAANSNRQRLMSYDYKTGDNKQVAATNYFNDVLVFGGKIYFAQSSTYQPQGLQVNFARIGADGVGKQIILPQETWNVFRVAYDTLLLSVPGQWYEFKTTGSGATKLDSAPANTTGKTYVDSPNGKKALWVDSRDGKGVLLSYDISAKKDAELKAQAGLVMPVRWLNDETIIYRVKTSGETADYVLNTNGGDAKKITDVTNTNGVDKWYYY